jgi:hypothetical protein
MRILAVAGLLAIGLLARAQTTPLSIAHAPDAGTRMSLISIDIAPLANAPFSAEVDTEWTSILADGSTATVWNRRTVARDSTGRVFQERRFLTPNGNTVQPALRALEYADPNRHEFYSCIVAQKTCYKSDYRRLAMVATQGGAGPVDPWIFNGFPEGAAVSFRYESLGQKTIENVEATGSREIAMLSAGKIGNQKPQPIVKEFWYSQRLGINLITKRFDPRSGTQNFIVADLSLNEPDPGLFEPPADYRVVRQVVERAGIAPSEK